MFQLVLILNTIMWDVKSGTNNIGNNTSEWFFSQAYHGKHMNKYTYIICKGKKKHSLLCQARLYNYHCIWITCIKLILFRPAPTRAKVCLVITPSSIMDIILPKAIFLSILRHKATDWYKLLALASLSCRGAPALSCITTFEHNFLNQNV